MEANRVMPGLEEAEEPFDILIEPVNPGEPHIAAAVAVDRSISMMGRPIREVNEGLKLLGEALKEDELASGRADITVISFGNTAETEMGFRPAASYQAPELTTDGLTALNEAIDKALDALEARTREYRNSGIKYYRPWLFVLTDGKASDEEKESAVRARLRECIEKGKVNFFPMGIGEAADLEKLRSYYPENAESKLVLSADKKTFRQCFVWISQSMLVISNSNSEIGGEISLPMPGSDIKVGY